MVSSLFTAGWEYRRGSTDYASVHLPHDAMISETRAPAEKTWAHGGYFPGGLYWYRTTLVPTPAMAGREVSLRFEGVYRHSRVLLDGQAIGGVSSGYREFEVRLDPYLVLGREHVIEVEVDNSKTPNSRWYTGSGIYRPVWLEVRRPAHIQPGGVAISTSIDHGTAVVAVDVGVANPEGSALTIAVSIAGSSATSSVVAGTARLGLRIDNPTLWSAETPALHTLHVALFQGDEELDRIERRVGLRTLELDHLRGLVVNGEAVTLRGANVHHDNGIVGAATFEASEQRRVRILKEAGFNAIRSAHNPASRALLDACDEYGMYVMDEAYDGWYDHKNDEDDAELFEATWRDEIASMVAKDRLHPSVIMYSIGNENGEALAPRGRRTAAGMTTELRRLDPDRFVTIGVNLVAASFAGLGNAYAKEVGTDGAKAAPNMTSTAINAISNRFDVLMKLFPKLKAADRSTRELFGTVDIAGYNYGTARYELDSGLHPERFIVGTESMPGDLARNWALTLKHPTVLGDFVWAGWDYIGEAGGGSWAYGKRSAPFLKPYPALLSGMGIFDITGVPGAALRFAQAAWGTLTAPAITVRPLDVAKGKVARTAWRTTDAVESWSWTGHEGERAEFEIYSTADEVEVLVNGATLGRRAVKDHLARFAASYQPGTVTAIGYRDGAEVSRSELRSAGAASLRLEVESDLHHGLAYIRDDLADADGIIEFAASDILTVAIDGPAVLAGFGNAAPATEESFADNMHSTYRGRALAAIRPTGDPGPVTITVTSTSHGTARQTFDTLGVSA